MFKEIEWIGTTAIDELIAALKELDGSELPNENGKFVKKQLMHLLGNALVSLVEELAFGEQHGDYPDHGISEFTSSLIERLNDATDPVAIRERDRIAANRDDICRIIRDAVSGYTVAEVDEKLTIGDPDHVQQILHMLVRDAKIRINETFREGEPVYVVA